MTVETGTILDAHEARVPLSWWKRRTPASPLQLATAALEDCRCSQLDWAQKSEHAVAMVKMFNDREKRLIKDIARLSKKPSEGLLEE